MNRLELECSHEVFTDVELTYPKGFVAHHVFCPSCREVKEASNSKKPWPLCWTKVIKVEQVSSLPVGVTPILPKDIMRLQSGVARNRVRPFPYVRLVRADAGITRPSGRHY